MSDEIAIKVENLSKIYKLYDQPVDRLKESINPFRKNYHKDFYALKDISLEVKKGETLGIVGKNGSGKSTLLKIITGVLSPSSGKVTVNGKVSALLELGAGFNPELTGIENVYLNGTLMGYTREEMEQRLDDIFSFADIGDFVYQPVKTYSSGMFVRLAFAVAINVDPDILIIDEALSVGDMRFQQKCLRKIEEFKKRKTILFVSHSVSLINSFCDRVLWVNEGLIIRSGNPYEISKEYQAFMIDSSYNKHYSFESGKDNTVEEESALLNDIDDIRNNVDVIGDLKAEIIGISLFDGETNEKVFVMKPGQMLKLAVKVRFLGHKILNPILGFTIKNASGNIVTEVNTLVLKHEINSINQKVIKSFSFKFKLPNFYRGSYTISAAIASGTSEKHIQHCYIHDAIIVEIINEINYTLQGNIFLDDVVFESLL